MNKTNMIELQNKIHAQNVELGWWDEERPFSTFACLFHSELSEAMEGDRKGLIDDHLPEYEMFWVELADFVIRCMDYLGSIENPHYNEWYTIVSEDKTRILAELHACVSAAFMRSLDGIVFDEHLINAIAICFCYSRYAEVDLLEIINKKVVYNKTRADHKRENRAKEGGKKY